MTPYLREVGVGIWLSTSKICICERDVQFGNNGSFWLEKGVCLLNKIRELNAGSRVWGTKWGKTTGLICVFTGNIWKHCQASLASIFLKVLFLPCTFCIINSALAWVSKCYPLLCLFIFNVVIPVRNLFTYPHTRKLRTVGYFKWVSNKAHLKYLCYVDWSI